MKKNDALLHHSQDPVMAENLASVEEADSCCSHTSLENIVLLSLIQKMP